MPILGVGVDVLNIHRIIALVKRRSATRIAARILSDEELTVWQPLSTKNAALRDRFLAVRFSVKEAAYKGLYPHARPTWKELTFLASGGSRKPTLTYHPSALATPIGTLHTSISHDGDYVFSTVVVEGPLLR
ncbi:uncharacterized protein FIBRA_05539 [Fibroporia radiculosa]|uniref:4'-phosphopantetheinyl transferase domain-containing protein n=1 Tax=Fibroporia radiculosa TaxID=599839 RepID=J4G9P2_9APHY|nr:uncharacterized protein FIBRA_05539 [Fibroporia radiculosa]CCM03408.1 predicted protein [Fibroporia radiculosa]